MPCRKKKTVTRSANRLSSAQTVLYIEPSAHNNTDSITTTFDLDLLCESLAEHGIAFRKAGKQSSRLCNHVYYCGLDYINNSKMQTKMVFIHTPDMNNFENIDGVVCG